MEQSLLTPELQELIENRSWAHLARYKKPWPDKEIIAPEIVDILEESDKIDRVLFFRALPKDLAGEVFSLLEGDDSENLLRDLTDQETRHLLSHLNPDDRTQILGELPGEVTQRLLNFLSPRDLKEARELLGYPEESVGRIMTPKYIALRESWTVEQALEHIRFWGQKQEGIHMIYITDRGMKLLDALPLKALVLADPQEKLANLMDYSFVSLSPYEDQENAVKLLQKYDRLALPVIDDQGILLGLVTVDDLMDVAEEEDTEDFHRSAAVSPLKAGYFETGVLLLYRSRIFWLSALVMVSLVSSGVISFFEETLSGAVVLTFFIPLIIGTGGNAGSQAATLMVRALGTGDVRLSQWLRVLGKEILVGLGIGLLMGILGLGLGYWRGGWELGLVVFVSLAIILLMANLLGILLPFLLTLLKQDPAMAGGPLITSLVDALGLLVYLNVARSFLGL